jgi:hypothetical protein
MNEKEWLEKAIQNILLTEKSAIQQHSMIMIVIEAYEAMKEI